LTNIKVKLSEQTKKANTGAVLVNSIPVQKQFVQIKLPNVWVKVKQES